jgi:hypothetical protein
MELNGESYDPPKIKGVKNSKKNPLNIIKASS